MTVPLPRQECQEVVEGHVHPVLAGVLRPTTLRHHHTGEGVVVGCFGVGFGDPFGKGLAGAVFDLEHQAPAVDADALDVAAVFGAGFDPAVDAVVVECLGEVVGDGPFGSGSGGLRGGSVSGHCVTA